MPCIVSDPTILHNIVYPPIAKPLVTKSTTEDYLKLLSTLEFTTSEDPKIAFDNFFDLVTTAGQLAFPLTKPKSNSTKNKHKPWMSKGLLSSCCLKNKLLNVKLKNPSPENIANYKKYNYLLNKCKKLAKRHFYLDSFESAKNNMKETWRLIGEVAERKKTIPKLSKVFDINGVLSANPTEIATSFNTFFGTIGPTLAAKIPPSKIPGNNFRNYMGTPTTDIFCLNQITATTLLDIISNLKPKTSAGEDLLSNKLLKIASKYLLNPLLRVINLSLESGYVPTQITLAKVIPILKEGDCKSFNNYRPIAIISSVGKVLEKVVSQKLTNYLESNELLSINQYGFRKGHSTSHPLLHFTKKIFDSLSQNKLSMSVFIDLKKAFDTVNIIDILLEKLKYFGIHGKEWLWFFNYLKRQQQVFTGDSLSEIIEMLCGIPQGTVLGPILFIMFINDLPGALDLFCQMFADDCTLQAEGNTIEELVSTMSAELAKAEEWFLVNKLTLNIKKTKFAVYGNNLNSLKSIPDLKIGGCKIDRIGIYQEEKTVRIRALGR